MELDLHDALLTFIAEGQELLEQMEESLLKIEGAPDDADTLNSIFRAVHTIKGSAGLFGLDYLVSFTHAAESVLDKVRKGEMRIEPVMVMVFLDVCDHVGQLLSMVSEGGTPNPEAQARSEHLKSQLAELVARSGALPSPASSAKMPSSSSATSSAPMTVSQPQADRVEGESGDRVTTDNWHISLRFDRGVLRDGMDPLSFVRYLTTFGHIARIVTLTEDIPPAAKLDPESCYLGFEISLHTEAEKAAIEDAFEYVRENCQIHIVPPHSKISEYVSLIEALPAEDMRIGDMLVACGTLTPSELERALDIQAEKTAACQPMQALGEVLVEEQMVRPAVVEAALEKQKQVKESKSAETTLIRVNAEKLDHHINLIGELIIASATASTIAMREGIPDLFEAAARMARLVEEVRDSALGLRMVQIGATFNKFQRVVHDVSIELGKDIRLEVSGAETELDKTVVERIGDPLTHLVRNSMDHGIEAAEVRAALGKPAHGTLSLHAYHDSGNIVIEVSDDGGGISRKRVLDKALERGLIKPDQVLSDSEILNLIFEPGFSTAEKVNNLSGRGVGMDVVRRNINALRGTIELESEEGYGTVTRIRLPLTLAIIDGFLVNVGASSFIVPLDTVVECVELSEEETQANQSGDHINLRGEVLPFIRLKELFDVPEPEEVVRDEEDCHEEIAVDVDPELAFLLQPVKRDNIVVVQYGGHHAGLVVDALQGEFQTVIRPLGAVFNGLHGITGFTVLGNGQVALILDVPGLVKRVTKPDLRHENKPPRALPN